MERQQNEKANQSGYMREGVTRNVGKTEQEMLSERMHQRGFSKLFGEQGWPFGVDRNVTVTNGTGIVSHAAYSSLAAW